MNKNLNGVIKLNENDYVDLIKPKGFIVREKIVDGKPVSLEYGIYITNEIFLGVPVHYLMKSSFIPLVLTTNHDADFNYYVLPKNRQFAVSTYTSKRTGKINPILVEPSDENPAVLISSLAYRDNINTITNIICNDNSLVLRKYIDKERKVAGLIMFNPDTHCINPSTNVSIEAGIIGSNAVNVFDYKFDPTIEGGYHKLSVVTELENGNKLDTSFIKLMNFIKPRNDKGHSERTNKPFNRK